MKLLETTSDFLKNTLIGGAILLGALTLHGQWLMIYVYWTKQDHISENHTQIAGNDTISSFFDKFQTFWIYAIVSSCGVYLTSGLFLHYYYYILQQDRANEWKCQPNRWLSNELQLDGIKTSITSLIVGTTFSASIVTYLSNGGHYGNVYYKWDDYSLLYSILQIPILFAVMDYALYWTHRIFHWPILYKMFHKVHHRHRYPTAFSTTMLHPFEIIVLMAAVLSPIFNPIFPIYMPIMCLILLYIYLMQILSHSGIDFKPMWLQPWQPETMFHDNHHHYFHVNFGFNLKLWDQIHGTIRQADRIYTEETFWGKGKSMQEANQEEKAKDLREREFENEKAHLDKYNEYFLFLENKKGL